MSTFICNFIKYIENFILEMVDVNVIEIYIKKTEEEQCIFPAIRRGVGHSPDGGGWKVPTKPQCLPRECDIPPLPLHLTNTSLSGTLCHRMQLNSSPDSFFITYTN